MSIVLDVMQTVVVETVVLMHKTLTLGECESILRILKSKKDYDFNKALEELKKG